MGKSWTYIALGSNKGNRFKFLQGAIDAIFKKIGEVRTISPIYETPAWGFKGNDFLNAVIAVKTRFSAEVLLKKLQEIERKNGRIKAENGYENRNLDLDILFYDDALIKKEFLKVPHPRISDRRFVLHPLADIAPDFIHPKEGKKISELLRTTQDTTAIKHYKKELMVPELKIEHIPYLVIEGNIGAGKTSLAKMIAEDFNAKLITERFKDNPFLPKFYQNKARYAFPLEMSFLADRYQQLIDDIAQYDLFNDFVVSDYDIYKSMIFAGVTLSEEEHTLYKKLFNIMYKDMAKPDLYIYLYQNTEQLLKNIKKRGREYEQNIPADYLNELNLGYLDFIKSQNHLNIKIIDVNDLDFVANREDYLKLIDEIKSAI